MEYASSACRVALHHDLPTFSMTRTSVGLIGAGGARSLPRFMACYLHFLLP